MQRFGIIGPPMSLFFRDGAGAPRTAADRLRGGRQVRRTRARAAPRRECRRPRSCWSRSPPATLGVVASLLTSGPGPLLAHRSRPARVELRDAGLRAARTEGRGGRQTRRTRAERAAARTWIGGRSRTPCALRRPPGAHQCLGQLVRPLREGDARAGRLRRGNRARNGVQVVGIALDDATPCAPSCSATGVTYPILLDTPGPADAGVRLGNPEGRAALYRAGLRRRAAAEAEDRALRGRAKSRLGNAD